MRNAELGTENLDDGTREMEDGTREMDDGTRKFADGARTVADGARNVADGLRMVDDGARKADDGTPRVIPDEPRIDGALVTPLAPRMLFAPDNLAPRPETCPHACEDATTMTAKPKAIIRTIQTAFFTFIFIIYLPNCVIESPGIIIAPVTART